MRSDLLQTLLIALLLLTSVRPADAGSATPQQVREESRARPLDLPTLAYVVHPVGKGPLPTSASLDQFAAELPDDDPMSALPRDNLGCKP